MIFELVVVTIIAEIRGSLRKFAEIGLILLVKESVLSARRSPTDSIFLSGAELETAANEKMRGKSQFVLGT